MSAGPTRPANDHGLRGRHVRDGRGVIGGFVLLGFLALAACGGKPTDTTAQSNASAKAPSAPLVGDGGSVPASRFASAAAPVDTSAWALKPPFYAAGAEPDWRLDLDDGWFVFRRSGLPDIEAPFVVPKKEPGADAFSTPPLKITIKPGVCEDDSGRKGVADVSVAFDGVDFGGCAYPATPAPASGAKTAAAGDPSAWLSNAASYVKGIDACLARLKQPALITAVYPRGEDLTAVALRTRNGSLYECGYPTAGGEVSFVDPVEPGSANEWMSTKSLFLRVDNQAAPEGCPDARPIFNGAALIGYSVNKKCKF